MMHSPDIHGLTEDQEKQISDMTLPEIKISGWSYSEINFYDDTKTWSVWLAGPEIEPSFPQAVNSDGKTLREAALSAIKKIESLEV